ncbi:MAG: RES family NAD+ phosphorylase [Actinomycetota bacterium]|nr:RES family NAD+ phosphorylase [Actinomycetota bacterium]
MERFKAVDPPTAMVWRVGRRPDPLKVRKPRPLPPEETRVGNRFDSISGRFSCLYLASDSCGCFMETLGRLRPKEHLADLVREEWEQRGWMNVGSVPADWRERRCRVQVAIDLDAPPFLDVDDAATLWTLDVLLRPQLDTWQVDELDTSVIRGQDRRVTRAIADWAWEFRSPEFPIGFAGIRYISRLDSKQECWAVFDDIEVREIGRTAISPRDPDVCYAAGILALTIH